MWAYNKKEFLVDEYEGYNGYSHKLSEPYTNIRHEIVKLGKNGKVIETVMVIYAMKNSALGKKIEENFTTIVNAINGELPELGNGPSC